MGDLEENHKEFLKGNRLTLKSKQSFKSKALNIFPEEGNKIVLNTNDDKRI